MHAWIQNVFDWFPETLTPEATAFGVALVLFVVAGSYLLRRLMKGNPSDAPKAH